jgi:hypothetical protein
MYELGMKHAVSFWEYINQIFSTVWGHVSILKFLKMAAPSLGQPEA